MNEKALLAVSFGTSVPEAEKAIVCTEEALRKAFPDRKLLRAFTSRIICRKLEREGRPVLSPEAAFERLAEEGCRDVLVQPTHLTPGDEYEKLCGIAAKYEASFERFRLGRPLICGEKDLLAVARAVLAHHPAAKDALVLMGHGADNFANLIYPALQTAFRTLGADNVFVGTVEGWPRLADLIPLLRRGGFRRVELAPLMLVAGDHARNDMAGDEAESWKNVLSAAGFEVACRIEGIGEWPEIGALYAAHAAETDGETP